MFIGGLKFQADPNLNIQLCIFDFILKLKGSNYSFVHKEVSMNYKRKHIVHAFIF